MRRSGERFESMMRGLAVVVAIGVAAPPSAGLAARTAAFPPVPRPAPDVTLEVEVAPSIVEAAELKKWVSEEGRRVLDGLPKEPKRRGSLRVEIEGALYEYRVRISAVRDGVMMDGVRAWACECSNEELLERVRGELVAGAEGLVVEVPRTIAEPEPAKASPPPAARGEDDRERQRGRGRLGATGAAGVALMVVGAAGVGTGIGLVTMNVKPPASAWLEREFRDLRPPGMLITGVSAGLLVTGVALYLLRDQAVTRRAAMLAPSVGRDGSVGFVASGRF